MDLRINKTKKAIINSFITLRSNKPLEKITIKELTDMAEINKATFYRHYEDIYALSESLEQELIANCLNEISDPTLLFSNNGVANLSNAFSSQGELFHIIFSGNRINVAIEKIHDGLMEKYLSCHPELQNSIEEKILFSALIYGGFYAYLKYKDENYDVILNSLSKLNNLLK